MQLAAAEAAHGIVHTFEGFLTSQLAAGRLELVLEDWSERFLGPFLYYASRHQMPHGLRAFVDFIKYQWRVCIPIKATAREPNKQAGYISATSDIQQIPSRETQPVHTFGQLRRWPGGHTVSA